MNNTLLYVERYRIQHPAIRIFHDMNYWHTTSCVEPIPNILPQNFIPDVSILPEANL